MSLSEHVYRVAVVLKMTERVQQQICIKFCIKLEHSFVETSDDSGGHSCGQLGIGSFIRYAPTHTSRLVQRFLSKHQITQVT